MSIGQKHLKWNNELDSKLIQMIKEGKTCWNISATLKICRENINKRLKEMGYDNYHQARKELYNIFVYKQSR